VALRRISHPTGGELLTHTQLLVYCVLCIVSSDDMNDPVMFGLFVMIRVGEPANYGAGYRLRLRLQNLLSNPYRLRLRLWNLLSSFKPLRLRLKVIRLFIWYI
jgi:hypothetical protein